MLGLFIYRDLVQLVERVLWEHQVVSSSLAIPTNTYGAIAQLVEQQTENLPALARFQLVPQVHSPVV